MEINSDIDLQYSPSKWCPNFSSVEAVELHIKMMYDRSSKNEQYFSNEYHTYLDSDATLENRYVLFKSVVKSNILIIYIHGGFWQLLDLKSSSFMADVAVSNDINYSAIGYNLAPSVSLETIVKEVRIAVKHLLKSNPEFDHVFLVGHSAGAHLALLSLIYDGFEASIAFSQEEKSRFRGLLLLSGIYDVRPICYTDNNENLRLTEDSSWRLSPLRCISRLCEYQDNLKVFVIAAEYDSPAFQKQSKDLYDALRQIMSNDHVFYQVVTGRNHFDLVHDIGCVGYKLADDVIAFVKS